MANIVRIVENLCHDELSSLNRGIGHLLGRPDLETPDNPLAPSTIVSAFSEALKGVKAENRIKFQILKELNQGSLADINANYDFVSVRAGIQPFVSDFRGLIFSDNNLGARVLGGDLTRADQYMVDVCVIGTAERPVRRSGAREGHADRRNGEPPGADASTEDGRYDPSCAGGIG